MARRWDNPRVDSIWKLGDKNVRTLGGSESFPRAGFTGKPLRCPEPAVAKEAVDVAAPEPEPPPASAGIGHIEIVGYHGCPFFVSAAKTAEALLERGEVASVTIRRAGQIHVPQWDSRTDRTAFQRYIYDKVRTKHWDGTSPHIVIDGRADKAVGATVFMQQSAKLLHGETLGLHSAKFWEPLLLQGAQAAWEPAYQERRADFFSADPRGAPLNGERNGIHYDDVHPLAGGSFARHSV
jgi:hypothetical protein